MRFIFIDEAGTSAPEPVTVVAGVIADADKHIMSADERIREILQSVPSSIRNDFVFHAMDIFNGSKYKDVDWVPSDRLRLLHRMMSVPRMFSMAICVSTMWRGATPFEDAKLSQEQAELIIAYKHCIAVSDRNIRNHAGPREIAYVVAEDNINMRKYIRNMPAYIKDNPLYIGKDMMRRTEKDDKKGYIDQDGDLSVSRIRNPVHFVEKKADLLVQVADAVAFGFRRYLSEEPMGVDFVRSILGSEEPARVFAAPGGTECYWFHETMPISGGDRV
ncbi:hypothetical protein J2X65_002059 [Ancylobacter sp. 3268]|uniref:DUF3800 domain-containing protein n=1 Tax=Ancylobacter sp. 3268 TaxID=2817752 RepID=UPI00285A0779|nr:DUF3800 domain-containing protein [Ancylobacter sp. 3268]MDR6952700.1 hypothetical protein [Ancylobacter sp. 3268]